MDRRDWITIVLLAFLFGGSFFFTAIASEDVGPFTIAASRLVIDHLKGQHRREG